MAKFDSEGLTFDTGGATFDQFGAGSDLCTFDSSLTTFDSSRTFDQTTCQDVEAPAAVQTPTVGSWRPVRHRFKVKYRGEDILLDTWAEVEALYEEMREVEKTKKKRNKKRPPIRIEPGIALKADLAKFDLSIEPALKAFDFQAVKELMDRLAMLEAMNQDEEDIEMLVLH